MSLTYHLQRVPDWWTEFVNRCNGNLEYVVGVDVFPKHDDVKVLGRTYLLDSMSNALVDAGAAGADAWIDKFAPVYRDNPHVHKWIGPNEYVLWDQESVDHFNAFHVRYIERMSALGHEVMCGQINTGWMHLRKYGDPSPYPETIAPTLAALWAHNGWFSTHEYWPGLNDPTGNIYRYKDFVAALHAQGIYNIPDLFISELGVDLQTNDPDSDYGHWGWKHFMEWPTYFALLKEYDQSLSSYVRGASIFTEGGGWETFELSREQALELADYIGQDTPPPPERAKGFMASKYQTTLNWDLIDREDWSYVWLRITGPNTPSGYTYTEIDPWLERHIAGADSIGLLKGGFHYLVPDLDNQARDFAEGVRLGTWELPLACDVEAGGLTRDRVDRFLKYGDQWLDGMGYDPLIIYTNLWLWGKLGPWPRDLWLAQPDVSEPSIDGWTWWQKQNVPIPDGEIVSSDVYCGTAKELYDKYGIPENGGNGDESMIEIVDLNGRLIDGMTWESVQEDYGLSLTTADVPEGEKVFRLVRLVYDNTDATNWRLYIVDENGVPLSGVAAFLGIYPDSGEELPDNMAPLIAPDTYQQPEGRPNRALVHSDNDLNFTDIEGKITHNLYAGSNYVPPKDGGSGGGTHWSWATGYYSDVPAGFGMFYNHNMFWPVFQLQTVGENGGNGEEVVKLHVTGTISVDLTVEVVDA